MDGHEKVTDLNEEQLQEAEYWFPYHYVSTYRDHFRQSFLDTWAINYVSTIEFLLEKVRIHSGASIVDIGCGDGRFSRELALAFPSSSVVGIDYSQRAIALAKAMNPDARNLRFDALDIIATDCGERFASGVLMEVFEHLPLERAAEFLVGVRRLLQPGAMLHVTVPHENKPLEYKHYQHFNTKRLVDYLSVNFEVVEVVPFERSAPSRRVLALLLSNRLFALNCQRCLNALYKWYKKQLFICESERDCQRLYVRALAK